MKTCKICGAEISEDRSFCRKCEEENKKKAIYSAAEALREKDTVESLKSAAYVYLEISDYKDSKDKIIWCEKRIKTLLGEDKAAAPKENEEPPKIKSGTKIVRLSSGEMDAVSEKIIEFTEKKTLSTPQKEEQKHSQSGRKIVFVTACLIAVLVAVCFYVPYNNYNKASNLLENEDYAAAIEAFSALSHYKDSAEKVNECRYEWAISQYDDGNYSAAQNNFEKCADYKQAKLYITRCQIKNAEKSLNANNPQGAIPILSELNVYEEARTALELYYAEAFSKAEIGSSVYFGTYEQDGIEGNGKEAVEWTVLDKKDDRVLLVSKNILEALSYNTEVTDVTWETSSIRTWLNDQFIKKAFGRVEQRRIKETKLKNHDNPNGITDGGNDTVDKVFLLSLNEVNKYFSSNTERIASYSAIAEENALSGYYKSWWLRTPGEWSDSAIYVDEEGHIKGNGGDHGGAQVDCDFGVRPAIWVSIT